MASALASQLARIAANSNNALNLKAQRAAHAVSLIFPKDVAVSQDFDSLYFICYESFAELCKIDKRFVPYAKTIFAEESKTYERDQQTAAENATLNQSIESFLGLVGGRLLLRPALRALEWLLRRFRVNEHNTASLILTFLPYHSNTIFTKLLQILPAKLPHAFQFLQSYRKDESLPPVEAVIYNAVTIESFSTALSDYVLKVYGAGNGHHALAAFWSSVQTVTLSRILENAKSGRHNVQRARQEDILTKLLPIISRALQIRDSPDLRTAVYMFLLVVTMHIQLQPKLAMNLIESILHVVTEEDQMQAVICIGKLAQSMSSPSITPRSLKLVLSKTSLVVTIPSLAQKHALGKLQTAILLAIADRGQSASTDELDLFAVMIQNRVLRADQTKTCLRRLLQGISLSENGAELDLQDSIRELLQSLARSPQTSAALAHAAEESKISLSVLGIHIEPSSVALVRNEREAMEVDLEDQLQSSRERSQELLASLTDTSVDRFAAMSLEDKSTLYGNLREAFLLASTDSAGQLSQIPFFQRQSDDDSSAISFLVRLWCGPDPQNCRAIALEVASAIVQRSGPKSPDYQALLPYVLVAFSDSSRKVRQAAADLVQVLESVSSASPNTTWGRKDLYENTEAHDQQLWLRTKDANAFLSTTIKPHLAECVADGAFVSRLLRVSFKGEGSAETNGKSDIKTAAKASIVSYLAAHAYCTPILTVKTRLIAILLPLRKISTQYVSTLLIPLLESWSFLDQATATSCCADENLDESAVNEIFCSMVSGDEKLLGLSTLKDLLGGAGVGDRPTLLSTLAARLTMIWPDMKEDKRVELAVHLLDIGFAGQAEVSTVALSSLRSVTKSEDVFSALLDAARHGLVSLHEAPSSKRRRVDRNSSVESLEIHEDDLSVAIRRLSFVLESIDSSDVQSVQHLTSKLFEVLEDLHKIQRKTHTSVNYVQGLLYETLVTCLERAKTTNLDFHASALHADILIECVQTTSSAQVRNSALLLVGAIADISPSLILHSVMPIFTFVGKTLLTQDDATSRTITGKLINQVIPAIVNTRQKSESVDDRILEILKSFVAALPHIPSHRTYPVYSALLKALGPESSFGLFLTLVSQEREDNATSARTAKINQLLQALSSDYDLNLTLKAIQSSIISAGSALDGAEDVAKIKWLRPQITDNERKRAAVNIVFCVEDLVDALATEATLSSTTSGAYNDAAADAIKAVISLRLQANGELANRLDNLLQRVCSILHGTQLANLLPPLLSSLDSTQAPDLLNALSGFMESSHKSRKDLRLLAPELLRCMLPLAASEQRGVRKAALDCLNITVTKYGKTDKTGSQKALASLLSLDTKDIQRIDCINALIKVLGEAVSPSLSQLGPVMEKWLKKASSRKKPDNARLQSILAALLSLCNAVPWFFSGETLQRMMELVRKTANLRLDSEVVELAEDVLEQLEK